MNYHTLDISCFEISWKLEKFTVQVQTSRWKGNTRALSPTFLENMTTILWRARRLRWRSFESCYGNALIKTRSNDDPESTEPFPDDNQRLRQNPLSHPLPPPHFLLGIKPQIGPAIFPYKFLAVKRNSGIIAVITKR